MCLLPLLFPLVFDFRRIEAVSGSYWDTSIKDFTRINRAKSQPHNVKKTIDARDVPLPITKQDCDAFLSMKENKTKLQQFVAHAYVDKLIVAAGLFENEKDVRSSQQAIDTRDLCMNHEEQTNE